MNISIYIYNFDIYDGPFIFCISICVNWRASSLSQNMCCVGHPGGVVVVVVVIMYTLFSWGAKAQNYCLQTNQTKPTKSSYKGLLLLFRFIYVLDSMCCCCCCCNACDCAKAICCTNCCERRLSF